MSAVEPLVIQPEGLDLSQNLTIIDIKQELIFPEPKKETIDRTFFKAAAKQKFDAVLKQEVDSRRNGVELISVNTSKPVQASQSTSQYFRIENARITNVENVSTRPGILSKSIAPPISQAATVDEPRIHTVDYATKQCVVNKINKYADGQMFIYDLLPVSSDMLIPTENNNAKTDAESSHSYAQRSPSKMKDEENMFRCFLCPYYNVQEMMIAKHWIHNHLTQHVYRCSYCPAQFTTNFQALQHTLETHPRMNAEIQIKKSDDFATLLSFEQRNLINPNKLSKNLTENKNPPSRGAPVSMKCDYCRVNLKSLEDFQMHRKYTHIRFRPHSCGFCNSKVAFASKTDLDLHMKMTHPNISMGQKSPSLQVLTSPRVIEEVNANMDWSRTWKEGTGSNMYECRWCVFQTSVLKELCQHAHKIHHCFRSLNCPKCRTSHNVKDEHFRTGKMFCSTCSSQINLVHEADENNQGNMSVYVCNICKYSNASKNSMNRHLKHSHSNCKPYCCPYCSYCAVERPKIRQHVQTVHPNKPVRAIEVTEENEAFKKYLDEMFSKLVSLEKADAFGNVISGDNSSVEKGDRAIHNQMISFPAPNGEYFQCRRCVYKCSDRSCMARHVKYMHLTSRPHSCPYCSYNNVEKTKVRIHVGNNHSNLPNHVNTNAHLLEQMSVEAKKFYVRIDTLGNAHSERAGAAERTGWNGVKRSCSAQEKTVKEQPSNDAESQQPQDKICEVAFDSNVDHSRSGSRGRTTSDCAGPSVEPVVRKKSEDDFNMEASTEVVEEVSNSVEKSNLEVDEAFGDSMIDLNCNEIHCSDVDLASLSDDSLIDTDLENKTKRIRLDCFDIEPTILEDLKISKMTPVVFLKDVDEDNSDDDENAIQSEI